jgi:hypothetical protein
MLPNALPNYHFLLIASNLGAEWLFDAARAYWERFRPTVVSDLRLVALVPDTFTVAVTVIARRDTVAQIGVELARVRVDALFDPVVYDFFDDARLALEGRAALNQPFGVPLATPVAAPLPTPLDVTPGPLPSEAPPGFITQTPTTQPTPLPTDPPQQPISPTPGAVSG